jgi:hypothetical protein
MEQCFSLDGEDFRFTSMSDLLSDLIFVTEAFATGLVHPEYQQLLDELTKSNINVVGTTYYVAEFSNLEGKDLLTINGFLDHLDENLFDEVGYDIGEGGLSIEDGAAMALEKFLIQWVDKHTDVGRFYKVVGDSREMKITEEDLKQYFETLCKILNDNIKW